LSVSNLCPKAISRVSMRLIYYDARGEMLKEWTTRREFDRALEGKARMELVQPAYFMPLTTKRVGVEIRDVHFSDGTLWTPK
jgi:hypothetical protein